MRRRESETVDELLRVAVPDVSNDRPGVPPAVLFDAITRTAADGRRRLRPRPRPTRLPIVVLAGAVAAVLTVAMVVRPSGAPVDIALVASASETALDSGRAEVRFSTGKGAVYEQSGVNHVVFAGDDLEMKIEFHASREGPAFDARNRTVDGEFYLYDGIPGRKYWVHDTATQGGRSDLFNIDPRTLLRLLRPSADFEDVGEEKIDGVTTRRLRARTLDDLPSLNLGLGPTDGQDARSLELWVGEDDVVRRIELSFQTTSNETSGAGTLIVKRADGTVEKKIDPAKPGTRRTVTTRSDYSVRFYDIGEPITIEAPRDATDIAGKG